MATPIYRKIKDLIMQEIEDKTANSPIDSERDMAVRFDASRMTVRKAIDELVEEGFLYRKIFPVSLLSVPFILPVFS